MHSSNADIGTLPSREARGKARSKLELTLRPDEQTLIVQRRQFPKTFAAGDIEYFNAQFIKILGDLGRRVQRGGLTLTEAERDAYLDRLRMEGLLAYNKVIPKAARPYIAEVEERERKRKRDLTLTFTTSPELGLFWEMLYAGKPSGPAQPEQFWGFRYPIGRTYWESDPTEYIQLQSGIFSAVHSELAESLREVEQLQLHLARVCRLLGRELTLQLLDQLILAQALSSTQLIEWFHSDDFRYGIVHFACHCDNPQDAGAAEAFLRVTTVHEQQLDMCLKDLAFWQGNGFTNQPLVFLNACESATPGHLLQTISFPAGFLDFGAGGVIATACVIPDTFAGAFATKFYQLLLDQERHVGDAVDIGETLLETRRHFLKEHNNPLGLAYSLYAASYQQLLLAD